MIIFTVYILASAFIILRLLEILMLTRASFSFPFEDALMGMKDLFLNHPEELKLHRYAVIEKLRERISDDGKIVRENLYQLLKSVILPGCKEVIYHFFLACLCRAVAWTLLNL